MRNLVPEAVSGGRQRSSSTGADPVSPILGSWHIWLPDKCSQNPNDWGVFWQIWRQRSDVTARGLPAINYAFDWDWPVPAPPPPHIQSLMASADRWTTVDFIYSEDRGGCDDRQRCYGWWRKDVEGTERGHQLCFRAELWDNASPKVVGLNPVSALSSCANLGKCLNLSVPLFSHLYMEMRTIVTANVYCMYKAASICRVLTEIKLLVWS